MKRISSNKYYCISCFFITLILFYIYGATEEKKCPRKGMNIALILPKREKCFHIHHWIIGAFLFILLTGIIYISNGTYTKIISSLLGIFFGIK